ncbi:MAG: tRNA (adenosine(37)-N6)-threonylcarbamoyltransferase complex dimerization subunit type 1 TsaB [Desulfohalobium sp.]
MTCNACSPTNAPVLVINGAESRLQVVLGSCSGLLWSQELHTPGRAMPYLAPAVRHGLSTCHLSLASLRGIACVHGPGGFTGLRLTLATALGLARGARLPLAGLDYLACIASGVWPLCSSELWVVTRARQRLVYLQGFAASSGHPLGPVQPQGSDKAIEILQTRPRRLTLVGSGLRGEPEHWTSALPEAKVLPPQWDHPNPDALVQYACAAPFAFEALHPLYLRVSDAETNLPAIAGKRGLDPETARNTIPDFFLFLS